MLLIEVKNTIRLLVNIFWYVFCFICLVLFQHCCVCGVILKSNSKELWKLINSVILNKRANNPIVKKLTVNNINFEEPEGISKQFNKCFVEIGHEIANNANSETSHVNF